MARWVMALMEFEFVYVHRDGAKNRIADALSRLRRRQEDGDDALVDPDDNITPIFVNAVTRRAAAQRAARRAILGPEAEGLDASSARGTLEPQDTHSEVPEVLEPRKELALPDGEGTLQPSLEAWLGTRPSAASRDMVSRSSEDASSQMVEVEVDSDPSWVKDQRGDERLAAIIAYLLDGVEPVDQKLLRWIVLREDSFVIEKLLLYWVDTTRDSSSYTTRQRLVVPQCRRLEVMQRHHNNPGEGGHFSLRRAYGRMVQYLWWPRMYSDVKEYIAGCSVCQTVGKRYLQKALIGGHPTGYFTFDFLAMDLLSMPTSVEGSCYCLVVMDYYSRYAFTSPLGTKSADAVAAALVKHVFMLEGPPCRLLSDNGGEFRNELMAAICRSLGIQQVFTAPYNPQCDGMVERFNRTLARALACYVSVDQSDWEKFLPAVTYAYNTTPSESTRRTPFEMVFHREPSAFTAREAYGLPVAQRYDPAELATLVADMRMVVTAQHAARQSKEERRANEHRVTPRVYSRGDVVLVASHVQLEDGAKAKVARKWRGPYVVTAVRGMVNVATRLLGSDEASSTMHVNNVKLFLGRGGRPLNILADVVARESTSAVAREDGQAVERQSERSCEGAVGMAYVVERVRDYKLEGGRMFFLLKWQGYEELTWERECNLNCGALVEDYFRSH